jgi:hypothetical protein
VVQNFSFQHQKWFPTTSSSPLTVFMNCTDFTEQYHTQCLALRRLIKEKVIQHLSIVYNSIDSLPVALDDSKQNKKIKTDESHVGPAKNKTSTKAKNPDGHTRTTKKRAADVLNEGTTVQNSTPPKKLKSAPDHPIPSQDSKKKFPKTKSPIPTEKSFHKPKEPAPAEPTLKQALKEKRSKDLSDDRKLKKSKKLKSSEKSHKVSSKTLVPEQKPLTDEELRDMALYGFNTSSEEALSEDSNWSRIEEEDLPKPPNVSDQVRQDVVAKRKNTESDDGPGVLYIGYVSVNLL